MKNLLSKLFTDSEGDVSFIRVMIFIWALVFIGFGLLANHCENNYCPPSAPDHYEERCWSARVCE